MKSKVRESFLRTKVKAYIPIQVQKVLYKQIKKRRLSKSKSKEVITKSKLKQFLIKSGLKKGDTAMVHSSLGRIGYIENGADDLIDAFLEVMGKSGTLVMPTFSVPKLKNGVYYFDSKNTPAYTGKVPETFRKRKGVFRSLQPMHSVVAYGKNAKYIVKDHDKCDNSFAMNGPFGKLYKLNAKIFLIGVDQLANSSIHIVEDKCKFPVDIFTHKLNAVVDKKKMKFKRHLSHLYKIRKNNIMEKYLLEGKLMRVCKFGNTELRVIKEKDFVHCMEKMLKKGITIYNQ